MPRSSSSSSSSTSSAAAAKRVSTVAKLKRLLQEGHPLEPERFLQVGKVVLDFHGVDSRQGYRRAVLKKLAEDVGQGCTAILLYRARSVAAIFTEEDVRTLESAMQQAGRRLTNRHLWQLVSVSDVKVRKRLVKQCGRKGWSTEELNRQIYEELGPRRQNAGSRPRPPETKSAAVAVHELTLLAKRLRVYGEKWLEGEGALLGSLPKGIDGTALANEIEAAMQDVPQTLRMLERFKAYLRGTGPQKKVSGARRKRAGQS